MTTLELSDLIQQQLLENPVLEEVHRRTRSASWRRRFSTSSPARTTTCRQLVAPSRPTRQRRLPTARATPRWSRASRRRETFETAERRRRVRRRGRARAKRRGDAFEEIDFGREFQDYLDPGYKTQEFEYKEDAPTFEQFLTRAPSLSEHLEWQLHMTQVAEELRRGLRVRHRQSRRRRPPERDQRGDGGRLAAARTSASRRRARSSCTSTRRLRRARRARMSARPARSARERRLPARRRQVSRGAAHQRAPLAELQQHKLPNLAKQMGVEVVELVEELQLIRTLDPYPGRRYSSDEPILIVARSLHREAGRRLRNLLCRRRQPAAAHQPRHAADAQPRRDDEGDAGLHQGEDALGGRSPAQHRAPPADDLPRRRVHRPPPAASFSTRASSSSSR